MNDPSTFLFQLFIQAFAQASGTNGIPLGYIVVAVIESPVIILLLAVFLGRHRLKVSWLFVGWLVMMFTAFVVSVYALGSILGLFY